MLNDVKEFVRMNIKKHNRNEAQITLGQSFFEFRKREGANEELTFLDIEKMVLGELDNRGYCIVYPVVEKSQKELRQMIKDAVIKYILENDI